MRKEENYNEQALENETLSQTGANGDAPAGDAFAYLKSLPPNFDRPALNSYKRGRNAIIDYEIAETFTDSFRGATEPFDIPVSWSMTKSALLNLLGITGHVGYDEVIGVRF